MTPTIPHKTQGTLHEAPQCERALSRCAFVAPECMRLWLENSPKGLGFRIQLADLGKSNCSTGFGQAY